MVKTGVLKMESALIVVKNKMTINVISKSGWKMGNIHLYKQIIINNNVHVNPIIPSESSFDKNKLCGYSIPSFLPS